MPSPSLEFFIDDSWLWSMLTWLWPNSLPGGQASCCWSKDCCIRSEMSCDWNAGSGCVTVGMITPGWDNCSICDAAMLILGILVVVVLPPIDDNACNWDKITRRRWSSITNSLCNRICCSFGARDARRKSSLRLTLPPVVLPLANFLSMAPCYRNRVEIRLLQSLSHFWLAVSSFDRALAYPSESPCDSSCCSLVQIRFYGTPIRLPGEWMMQIVRDGKVRKHVLFKLPGLQHSPWATVRQPAYNVTVSWRTKNDIQLCWKV